MKRDVRSLLGPAWTTVGVGVVATLMSQPAFGQLPVPVPSIPDAVPGVVQGATDTAQGTVQSATDTAQGAAATAQDAVSDTANTATSAAQDATGTATNAAQDAAGTATNAAQSAAQTTTDTAAGAAQTATGAAQGAAQTATDTAQDATKTATDAAQDASKTATDAAQDASKTATDATRDAASTATDATRDAAGTAAGTTRDAAKTATDATRDAAGTARDTARDARDTARETTRDARDAARETTQDARETARDLRGTARETNRDLRDTAQDAARGARGQMRDSLRDNRISARAAADLRGADLGLWFNRSSDAGLVIADIAANAALGRYGFTEGDRIVSVAGTPVRTEADFVRLLLNPRASGRMNVVVWRDGHQQTLYLNPVEIRQQVMHVHVDPLEQFGVILDDRYTDRLIVWRVIPRSPAFYAGIRSGDVITTFAGRRITSPQMLVQTVQEIDPGMVAIQVNRDGRARTIEADLPDMQVSQRTTARQNLDVDAGGRNDETYIRSEAGADVDVNADVNGRDAGVRARTNVEGEVDADLPQPADAPPAIEDRSNAPRSYNNNPPQRRGLFRRRG